MTPSVQPRLRGVLIAVLAVAPTFLVVALALADAPSSGPEIRAQLSPRRYTTLSAEVAARVLRLPVHEGERFRSGQRLVELDCTLQTAQLDKARAQLSGAETTMEGYRRLAALDAVGRVELGNSEAEVAKARADVSYLAATVEKCAIAAPFDGRVAEQKAREYQFVQPGQPLLEILDDSRLELDFIAPSRWLAWLRAGQAFQVQVDDTGRTYPARVQRIGAHVDPVSQTIKVVAVVNGTYSELLAGMSGRVLMSPPRSDSP